MWLIDKQTLIIQTIYSMLVLGYLFFQNNVNFYEIVNLFCVPLKILHFCLSQMSWSQRTSYFQLATLFPFWPFKKIEQETRLF